jgi:hypothetical protein
MVSELLTIQHLKNPVKVDQRVYPHVTPQGYWELGDDEDIRWQGQAYLDFQRLINGKWSQKWNRMLL